MDRDRYLEHLARDGRRMAELAGGDLGVPVPTCPDWKLVDLIEHTGMVHRWQTAAVRDRVTEFPDAATFRHGPAEGQSWSDWFQAGVDEAVAVLGAVAPDEPRWTWFAQDQSAGWYHRRITQETAVHRIDAERAALGTAAHVDPELAVDGINEIFDMFLAASGPEPIGGSGETVHLHATDAEGEWLVTMHPETITVERGHAKGDAALRGLASDLLLYVWGREPTGEIELFGDATVRDRLFAAFKL